jgi:hypothetical protein
MELHEMKSGPAVIGVCLLGVLLWPFGAAGGGGEPSRTRAAAAVATYAAELKQALTDALSSAGPLGAIEVCNIQAPAIGARVSEQSGVRVSRTSERTRNPRNSAVDWQTRVLRGWATQIESGADPATLEHFEATGDGGFRYMKPIVVQPLCLPCHGTSMQPDVAATLEELYPDDRATGYSAGDLRGAFVVEY